MRSGLRLSDYILIASGILFLAVISLLCLLSMIGPADGIATRPVTAEAS